MSLKKPVKTTLPITLAVIVSFVCLFIAMHEWFASEKRALSPTNNAAFSLSSKATVQATHQRHILSEEDWKRLAKN